MKKPSAQSGNGAAFPKHLWPQVEKIVSAALESAPEQWPALLDQACADNAQLRAEVVSLLGYQEKVVNFIEQPALALTPESFLDSGLALTNQRLGSYKLLREIGRGGMGTVYLAERADEQYQKLVAIKIVRRGMDTDDILRRFRNERQILASLDHPNIARLLDGGTTDDGLPYLVMEYVEGVPVTDYCEAQRLSTNERLQIFRTICAAVQHAHQKLVMHRDLKPSNILITPDGVPKLLDFGIAKVFNQTVAEPSAEYTLTGLPVFTPYYASPEQVRGETLTTTSDVYSLGLLLYELLTGLHPYHSRNTPPHELVHIICDQEPARPSDAIADFRLQKAESETSFRTEIGNPKSLRGDLDNIILMALRKEPARRYASVDQFSEDVRRHLDGLPVVARKDTFKYRATKFMRRNRLGVAAAAIILLSLVGGMVATAWQARAARAEKVKAESVNTFLKRLLTYSNPLVNVPGKSGGETTMKDVLNEAAKRLDSPEFSSQLEVRAQLEKILADSYFGQGRQDLWEVHLKKFIAIQTSLYSEDSPQTIEATAQKAILSVHENLTEAESIFRRVMPRMRKEYQKGNISATALAESLNNFGYLRRTQGDSTEAASLFRETLTLSSRLPVEQHYLIGLTRCTLASTLADEGRFDEALETARQAVAEYRQNGRSETPDFGFALTVLGGFLTDKGDFAETEAILKEGETILRQRQSPSSLWLGDNLRNQAISFYQQGRYAESQSKITETEKIYLESFGPTYDNYPTVLIVKGLILVKTDRPQEGEKFLRDAVKLRTDSLPKEHYWVALANSALGECLTVQKRFAAAEPLLLESYQSLRTSQGANNPRTTLARQRLIALYESWGRNESAAEYRSKP
ncbi:MAG: serine/threonine protein kinase [Acidobacteria bacterium]|nr:serine/threonine protein kinase [Acidobacteriota bacterium]